jgi:hypothetical protein
VNHIEAEKHGNVQPRFLYRRLLNGVDVGGIDEINEASELAFGGSLSHARGASARARRASECRALDQLPNFLLECHLFDQSICSRFDPRIVQCSAGALGGKIRCTEHKPSQQDKENWCFPHMTSRFSTMFAFISRLIFEQSLPNLNPKALRTCGRRDSYAARIFTPAVPDALRRRPSVVAKGRLDRIATAR